MKLTIDTRSKGFRAIWQDGRGNQGRALLSSETELKEWLVRFDFASGGPAAARSFAQLRFEDIEADDANDHGAHDEESRGSDGE